MLFGTDRLQKTILIGILGLLALSQIACGQSATQKEQERIEQVMKHEEAARQFREKGDFQAALAEQQKAVELNPDDDESLRLLGGIYIELKQWDNAIEILERGKKINPNNGAVRYELFWAEAGAGNKNKSLSELKEAARLSPDNVIYLTNLGIAYGDIDEKVSEREAYNKALEINPNYLTATYNLALLEAEENNKPRAIELLKKMLSQLSTTKDEERIKRVQEKLKELEQSKK